MHHVRRKRQSMPAIGSGSNPPAAESLATRYFGKTHSSWESRDLSCGPTIGIKRNENTGRTFITSVGVRPMIDGTVFELSTQAWVVWDCAMALWTGIQGLLIETACRRKLPAARPSVAVARRAAARRVRSGSVLVRLPMPCGLVYRRFPLLNGRGQVV